jgi:hypothetical protein
MKVRKEKKGYEMKRAKIQFRITDGINGATGEWTDHSGIYYGVCNSLDRMHEATSHLNNCYGSGGYSARWADKGGNAVEVTGSEWHKILNENVK